MKVRSIIQPLCIILVMPRRCEVILEYNAVRHSPPPPTTRRLSTIVKTEIKTKQILQFCSDTDLIVTIMRRNLVEIRSTGTVHTYY